MPAGAAGRAGPTSTTDPAIANQARSTTRTPGHAGVHPGGTITAVAVQQPAGPTGRSGCRPVGAVADQRATQERQSRRVDETQHVLLHTL
ncbi:hypothetical protein LAUMK7_04528 [Mycobacterium kansasii]|nr:hypothetical protein LAUMK22_03898 [Mycobacterium kansasii]VAZ68513.1 hypothetical protein LAUMK40_04665 [Mycobacterium kansasii]VAZ78838.1 hypothetical protein LAUMK7_04528 [Mycobacterium kansasii]